jgi:dihydrodipicolinate synthase/N-acetylneuraminate lyase
MILLHERNWTGALVAAKHAATSMPQSRRFRALLNTARAREHQAAGRINEAVLEVQRALQLDPELAPAKQALDELQRKR